MTYSSFTSESVCAGHPDKVCDQISDAIVDAVLAQDHQARLGVETAVAHNRCMIFGEVSTSGDIDYEQVARSEIARLGYTNPAFGFDSKSPVDVRIRQQSAEIAQGVDQQGAGDQGMMFGYACTETPIFMPMPITLAHAITRKLDDCRVGQTLKYLLPDGKSQVTILYREGRPVEVAHVTVAVPHSREIPLDQVRSAVLKHVIKPALEPYKLRTDRMRVVINGTGIWHSPGPSSDAGLTGRKIVVDTYGGYARVGGGAFSGKDPSKVDRSGAYAARYIAKNIVAAGLADRAEIALAYVIGLREPIMQEIDTFGTSRYRDIAVRDYARALIDTSVPGIIDHLDLRRPVYHGTATYGHFGNPTDPWEQTAIAPQPGTTDAHAPLRAS